MRGGEAGLKLVYCIVLNGEITETRSGQLLGARVQD